MGHIGFSVGLMHLIKAKSSISSQKEIYVYAPVIALLPDVFDRLLGFFLSDYLGDHSIFHSLFFYPLILIVVYILNRKIIYIPIIMMFNILLDIVNCSPGALLFPFYQMNSSLNHGPIIRAFMLSLPKILSVRIYDRYYLIFELLGFITLLASLFLLKKGKING